MKKKISISLFMLISIVMSLNAQVKEVWKTNLDGSIVWQQVNSFGNFLVCTSNELTSINPETGEKVWANKNFANISESQVEQQNGSPLMFIDLNNTISMVEPYSGEVKFNSSVEGFKEILTKEVLFKSNSILIAGNDSKGSPIMLMIDIATGKTIWKIQEKFGKIITVKELSKDELIIVTLFNIYKIKSADGKVIWKSATSKEAEQISSMGALGGLMQGFAEKAASDAQINMQFYMNPSNTIFILGAEVKSERQGTQGSTPVVTYSNSYTAFKVDDGKRVWTNPIEMSGKFGCVEFYEEGFMVLPADGNSTKINCFNMATGTGMWGKKGKGVNVKGSIYSILKVDNGYLIISMWGEKNYLNFLNPAQGLLTFEKSVKINGEVIRTLKSSKGILYITSDEINILNTTTGDLAFEKSVPTSSNLVEQKENTLYVFDTKENLIKSIDIEAGTVKNLTSVELKFEGKEKPSKLEVLKNGIFLSSEQNVALFDFNGALVYKNYYEAPREPGLKRALLLAQGIRAAYIGANAYYAAGKLQSTSAEVKNNDAVTGAIAEGFGKAYESIGNQASDFATKSIQQAFARFKASAQGRDFVIIFSKIDKNNALLKINKITGEIDGSINLGEEKQPVYAVDDVTGQVFLKKGETEVVSYKL